jgi:hypothetical protein
MTYRQAFDRLGNPVQPAKPDWQHKLIQRAAWVTVVACAAIMLWGR